MEGGPRYRPKPRRGRRDHRGLVGVALQVVPVDTLYKFQIVENSEGTTQVICLPRFGKRIRLDAHEPTDFSNPDLFISVSVLFHDVMNTIDIVRQIQIRRNT